MQVDHKQKLELHESSYIFHISVSDCFSYLQLLPFIPFNTSYVINSKSGYFHPRLSVSSPCCSPYILKETFNEKSEFVLLELAPRLSLRFV